MKIDTFNVEISYKKLFQSPTVADMAEMITRNKIENIGKDADDLLSQLQSISEDKAKQILDDNSPDVFIGKKI